MRPDRVGGLTVRRLVLGRVNQARVRSAMPQCVYCQNDLAPNATSCPHCGNTDPLGAKARA